MVLACVIGVIALALGSLFGDRGVLHLMSQRQRSEALEREVADLRAENARLASEVDGLRHDPHAIEKIAREQLGLARPGEMVFVLRRAPAAR